MEEIVSGIDVFRETFATYADSFIVIGGSACRAVIPEGDIRPRKTTDIDMVLVPQELSADFVSTFWRFIKDGGYKFASRKNGDGDKRYVFYSFVEGKEGFPDQIELLSKPDESIGTPAEHHIEYIDTGEEYSHLSAIILDRNYYDYLTSHFEMVDGIRYASADALVCLKEMNASNDDDTDDMERDDEPVGAVDENSIGSIDPVSSMDEIMPDISDDIPEGEYSESENELSLDAMGDEEEEQENEDEESE